MKRFFHIATLLVTLTILYSLAQAQNPDGDPIGRGTEVNDQRAGSMLIYNYYTSSGAATITGLPSTDTRLLLTNKHETLSVQVRLYFIDGATGQVSPPFITRLAPVQTQSFLASEIDPNVTGYVLALACNDGGQPMQYDHLMGTAVIQLASGHQATLGALAVPINADSLYGTSYAALPRQLALDQIPSPADGIKQLLVINRIDGSLYSGMPAIGTLNCDLFNPAGARFSFTSKSLGPQSRAYFYDLSAAPFTTNYLRNYLTTGQYGWLRLRPTEAGAITGAVLYFKESRGITTPYPGSFNLRHLTKTQATLEDPTGILGFGY